MAARTSRQVKIDWLVAHHHVWVGWDRKQNQKKTLIVNMLKRAELYSPSTNPGDIPLKELVEEAEKILSWGS